MNWGAVIPTKDRLDTLVQAIRHAATQTCPPAEIVVVDASGDFDAAHRRLLDVMAELPSIPLKHLRANRKSLTHQRNQGTAATDVEIVFCVDDDSLLYHTAAERVMEVYDRDVHGKVGGIEMAMAFAPPAWPVVEGDAAPDASIGKPALAADDPMQKRRTGKGLYQLARRMLRVSEFFVPYDKTFPTHPWPEELTGLPIGPIRLMHGCRMTYRRSVLLKEPFSEDLEGYCYGEDADCSYRVSRHKLILTCFAAKVCHLFHGGSGAAGRPSLRKTAALEVLNHVALHRLHSSSRALSTLRLTQHFALRSISRAVLDLSEKDVTLPRFRGAITGLRRMPWLLTVNKDTVRKHLPALQRRVVGAATPAKV